MDKFLKKITYQTVVRRNKFIPSIFSNNGIKLDINYKKKTGKFTNMWKLNNMLLKD